MAAQSERVRPDIESAESRPIELITENGFSIVRSWEVNGEAVPAETSYAFVVRDEHGLEQTARVEITQEVITLIAVHTSGRIRRSNSFWIACAERHLAAHLARHDKCPEEGQLRVDTLTPGDLNLSVRWERT